MLVFTRGGNPAGNPQWQAVGESAAGGAAAAAAHIAGGWTLKEEEAVRQACEATKGKPYEVAYEEYKKATSRSVSAFVSEWLKNVAL